MTTRRIKPIQIILAILVFIAGVFLMVFFSGSIWYFGGILITLSIIYSGRFVYRSLGNSNDEKLRSRTREQLLKHQHRR